MNEPPITGAGHRSDHPALRLDAACDRFEAAWRAGRRPRIEDCLVEAAESERTGLLRELLEVERELRRGEGETPGHDGLAAGSSRFRILRRHASGGLGEVFVAYDEELRREVALKEIRPDRADDGASRARFVLEAEITGHLEHPGVVPVYGRGEFGDGRPFYAMRFIEGDSLKAAIARLHAADGPDRDPGERALALRGLLRRFIDVCNAIAYAHDRGVLHRDLKPGNIMLGKYGETLVVDWGLAKAIGQPEGGAGDAAEQAPGLPSAGGSTSTVAGSALGTPAYMSPEQAAGALDRLGPRSDVYSLGATLYCLLTGRAPLDESSGDTEELLRRARAGEIAPPRAAKREVPPALEAVCQRAMARRPEDRYGSARALADDVENWLADEPVTAWREPWTIRARRWARRHRAPVAAAVVALLAGVIGLAALAGVEARANLRLERANEATELALAEARASKKVTEEALAQTKAAQAETRTALAQSEQSRRQAEAVSTFLVEAFRSPDPSLDGRQVKVVDVLDRAGARLDKEFAGSPATHGTLLNALGTTYQGLGLYDRAASLHARALAVREVALGPDHPDTLRSRNGLAGAYWVVGRKAEAAALYEATLEAQEARLGPEHPDTLVTRGNLAASYAAQGRWAESTALREATLALSEAKLGSAHRLTLLGQCSLAGAYWAVGRRSEAAALYAATLEAQEARLGPEHPDTLVTRNNLAVVLEDTGRTSEAMTLYEATLRAQEARLGPDHFDTHLTCHNLAGVYEALGRWTEAERLRRDVLTRRRRAVEPDSLILAEDLIALARNLLGQSRWSEAEPPLREALAIREKVTPDDWSRYDDMSMLGAALLGQSRWSEAEPLIVAGYEGMKARETRITLTERYRLREAAERIARLYEAWDRPERAAAWKATLGLRDLPADVFARP